jgi:hypothetical protein
MSICYLDEAGDLQGLAAPVGPNDQPIFLLAGITVAASALDSLTHDFLNMKRRFFPNLAYRSKLHLDSVLAEVKGAHVRRVIASGNRNQRRHAFGFLDKLFDVLEANAVTITGMIWIKAIGRIVSGTSLYANSVQRIFQAYDHYLNNVDDFGICLIDSRAKGLNVAVAHAIFTQKFGFHSHYARIAELPAFVHSENHAGIQIADMLCSAVLYPMAAYEYWNGLIGNVHVRPQYANLRLRYASRLKRLQFRYVDKVGRRRGGLTVSDPTAGRSGALLFHEGAPLVSPSRV